MREIKGNIWDFHKQGCWITITTNGTVRVDESCVMGKGVASQAKIRFPKLPHELGKSVTKFGNHLVQFAEYGIVTFPVKYSWWEEADMMLIKRSTQELIEAVDKSGIPTPIYMVRPGCGNGGLDWKDVKPIIEVILDDRFIVVEIN